MMKEAVGWHALIPGPITGPEEALAFINGCGFCTWGPVPRLSFPNLAEAMGETATSVLERTWSWKDDLHFEQQLYYGKIITGQPSFLSPDYLPDFISALAGRGLEQERDVARLYFDGRLSDEAKIILRSRRVNCGVAPGSVTHPRSWRPSAHLWSCSAASWSVKWTSRVAHAAPTRMCGI